jgi:hypothetical protein
MVLTLIASRLRQMADRIDALPASIKSLDLPDLIVPKFVMNSFVDLKLIEALRDRSKKPGEETR